MKKIVKEWIREAVDTFGYDLEDCWCGSDDKKKMNKIKKALEKVIK